MIELTIVARGSPEFQAAEEVGVRGDERRHRHGDGPQDLRLRNLEEVIVAVLGGGPTGSQGEGPCELAGLVDPQRECRSI